VLAFLVFLQWAVPLVNAQESMPLAVPPVDPPQNFPLGGAVRFSEGGVTFEPFTLSKDPVIAALLVSGAKDRDFVNQFQFAGHLSNSSGKSIVGMTSIWTWANASGVQRRYTFWGDYLLLYKGKIYPEEFSGLVTGPGPFWMKRIDPPAFSISRLFGMVTLDDHEVRPTAEEFQDSYPVTYELDTVILEDGTVLGPGRSQTMKVLAARQEAIDIVSAKMLELLDRQKDPAEVLTQYAGEETELSDPVRFWSARVARIFLAASNPRAIAAQLSENRDIVLHHNH
jgi:hypothetical protein